MDPRDVGRMQVGDQVTLKLEPDHARGRRESARTMMTPYFCDGLKDVTILNGTARLEFHRLLPVADGELQAISEVLIALPAQGLVQMLSVLEQVREGMIREQLLDNRPAADHRKDEAQTSPNFA